MKKLMTTILATMFDNDLSELTAQVTQLQRQLQSKEAELRYCQWTADPERVTEQLERLRQVNVQLKAENRRLSDKCYGLELRLKRRASRQKEAAQATKAVLRHKSVTGWDYRDIRALRQFQDLPLTELGVMFSHHTPGEIQAMLIKVRNDEA
ncbi:MAG: hypothetical protein Kow0031_24750 [Anaerolineae bacterium]